MTAGLSPDAQPRPEESLPQLPGPKLAPFTPTAYADIEFIKELGDRAVDKDSIVWKVRINGAEPCYALKMFHFNSALYLRKTIGGYLTRWLATEKLYIDYFEPFACEARAYGRLKQEDCEHATVRAHGYLLLTPAQEREVAALCAGTAGEVDPDYFGRSIEPLMADCPVRAIVKELVEGDDIKYFEPRHVEAMAEDLETLHRLGVLVRDVKANNYLGGKLVDLSRAWTAPHPTLEHIYHRDLQWQRERDPEALNNCIVDWGMDEEWDWSAFEMPEELVKCAMGESEHDGCGWDPRRYEWRKWEEDPEAAEEFLREGAFEPEEVEEKAETDGGREEEEGKLISQDS